MTFIADVAAPGHRLQGALAADGGAGRLADRADGRPAALALRARDASVPVLTAATLLTAIGLSVWIWEPGDSKPIIEGALAVDPLALGISVLVYIAGIAAVLLSLRARAVREAGPGRVLRAPARLDRRDGGARRGREPDHAVRGSRAALDPALRAVRHRAAAEDLARGRAQVPGGRLGGLRHAALRAGPHLRRHRRDGLPGHPGRHRRRTCRSPTRSCSPASP